MRIWTRWTTTALASAALAATISCESRRAAASPPRTIANWTELDSGGLHVGPPSSPVTIVEFGDFECPPCQRASTLIADAVAQGSGNVALEFRHLPLTRIHPFALDAARVAVCASRVVPFDAVYRTLYRQQDDFGVRSWGTIAHDAGVADTVKLAACMSDPQTTRTIERDVALARQLKITSTPTLIINGAIIVGEPDKSALASIVASARGRR